MTLRISSVEGNRQRLDGGAMFGNAPRTVWSQWIPPDEEGRIELACRSLVIETPHDLILCEAGIGAFFDPKMAERFGVIPPDRHMLLENLKKMGYPPEDFTWVILSHLHFDHAGGILPAYNSPSSDPFVFPKAKFAVGKLAFERAQKPHLRDRASFIPDLPQKLIDSGRLVLIQGDSLPGLDQLSFRFTHGHTPGQMHVLLRGKEQSVFFCGDLIPGIPWIHLPITMGYDRFGELVIDEKHTLSEEAIRDKWLLFYTHDQTYSLSQWAYDGKKVVSVLPEKEVLRRPL
jgi:glyoxylase-like metal-dependent hydrolase (beta-lactamase superfamily II)